MKNRCAFILLLVALALGGCAYSSEKTTSSSHSSSSSFLWPSSSREEGDSSSSSSSEITALAAPSLSDTYAPYLGDYRFSLYNPNPVACTLHYPSYFSGGVLTDEAQIVEANRSLSLNVRSAGQGSLSGSAYFTYHDLTSPECSIRLSMEKPGQLLSVQALKTPAFGVDGSFRLSAHFYASSSEEVATILKSHEVSIVGNYGDSAASTTTKFTYEASKGSCSQESTFQVSYVLDIAPGAPLYSSTYLRLNWIDKTLGVESGFSTLYIAKIGDIPTLSASDISFGSETFLSVTKIGIKNDHNELGGYYTSTFSIVKQDKADIYAYLGNNAQGEKTFVGTATGWKYDAAKKVYQKTIQNESTAQQVFYGVVQLKLNGQWIGEIQSTSVSLRKAIYAPRPTDVTLKDEIQGLLFLTHKIWAGITWSNPNDTALDMRSDIDLNISYSGGSPRKTAHADQEVASGGTIAHSTEEVTVTADLNAQEVKDSATYMCGFYLPTYTNGVQDNLYSLFSFSAAVGQGVTNITYDIH
jgi:hypothetical protein